MSLQRSSPSRTTTVATTHSAVPIASTGRGSARRRVRAAAVWAGFTICRLVRFGCNNLLPLRRTVLDERNSWTWQWAPNPSDHPFSIRISRSPNGARRCPARFAAASSPSVAMAYIVVLNPLILGSFSADDAAAKTDVLGNILPVNQVAAVTALVAGSDEHRLRYRRELSVRDRGRPGHQQPARRDHRPAGDVARGDGPGGHRRHHHRGAGAHRFPHRRVQRDSRRRSRQRSPPVSARSSRSSVWSTPDSSAASPTPPAPRFRSDWVSTAPSRRGRPACSSSACCSWACWWSRKVRGGLLIGIVVTTILAVIIEAVADVGPSLERTPRAGT